MEKVKLKELTQTLMNIMFEHQCPDADVCIEAIRQTQLDLFRYIDDARGVAFVNGKIFIRDYGE